MELSMIGGYCSKEYNITFYMLKEHFYTDKRGIGPWVEVVKKR